MIARPAQLAVALRDGHAEAVHRGDVAVTDADGRLLAGLGNPGDRVYVRSAAKPFQALASLELLAEAGVDVDVPGRAIMAASHSGSDDQQVEAARLLALAGLDERALRCPAALPADLSTLLAQRRPTSLAHNCSGKHAGFLLAHTATGGDPSGYLALRSRLQTLVRERLVAICGAEPTGPGVDGCGAPAWRLPLRALATGFARLAGGDRAAGPVRLGDAGVAVRRAMTARPDLVGGVDAADTLLMLANGGLVAKRGAEGVLAVGYAAPGGPLGLAVKIADGAGRAVAPALAPLLSALGATVPDPLAAPPVLGGGRPRGRLSAADAVLVCARGLAAAVWGGNGAGRVGH